MTELLWYAVHGHPDGPQGDPVFRHDATTGEVRDICDAPAAEPVLCVIGDEAYRSADRSAPIFVIRGSIVYPTDGHPFGAEGDPWYQIRASAPDPTQ